MWEGDHIKHGVRMRQEPEIPESGEYLKVVYPAEYPALPPDLAGRSFRSVPPIRLLACLTVGVCVCVCRAWFVDSF